MHVPVRMSTFAERRLVRCALLLLALVNLSSSYVDLSNLGQEISESVNRQVAPLANLGQRINRRVNHDLYRAGIGRGYYQEDAEEDDDDHFVPNLGSRIGDQVAESLRPLQNLGPQIEQSVYESLEPVRAIEIVAKMKDGVGGNTVKTFLPGGKTFLRKNGRTYTCGGTISSDNGHCRGNLVPFQAQAKEDQCFADHRAYLTTNEGSFICVSVDGFATVSVFNNKIVCEGRGGPATLIPKDEYTKLCGNSAASVKYRYYAENADPMHVEIPSKNRYVKCVNSQPGVCEFTDDQMSPGGAFSIVVSGGNGNFQSTHHGRRKRKPSDSHVQAHIHKHHMHRRYHHANGHDKKIINENVK